MSERPWWWKDHPSWKDTNFAYLEDEDKRVQRWAVLYEYARESPELIATIKDHQEDYDFPKSLLKVYERDELEFLASTVGFPKQSFQTVFEREAFDPQGLIGALPTQHRIKISRVSEERLERELRYLSLTSEEPSGTYLISIPWEVPKTELVRQFKQALQKLAPSKLQRHPGRRGTPHTKGGMEALWQLSAYREHSAGIKFPRGTSPIHTSKKGWAGAIKDAYERIVRLMSRSPLY